MFFSRNIKETIDNVQSDVTEFVTTELQVYLANDNNRNFNDSVIANIALFSIEGINSEQGYTQIQRLLGDHYDQMIERRMRQLLHMLYIRYGKSDIESIRKRVIDTMMISYPSVYPQNIRALNKKYITFWLIPFIKEAYNTIVLTSKK